MARKERFVSLKGLENGKYSFVSERWLTDCIDGKQKRGRVSVYEGAPLCHMLSCLVSFLSLSCFVLFANLYLIPSHSPLSFLLGLLSSSIPFLFHPQKKRTEHAYAYAPRNPLRYFLLNLPPFNFRKPSLENESFPHIVIVFACPGLLRLLISPPYEKHRFVSKPHGITFPTNHPPPRR